MKYIDNYGREVHEPKVVTFTQPICASQWTVPHNKGRVIQATTLDENGNRFVSAEDQSDLNTAVFNHLSVRGGSVEYI